MVVSVDDQLYFNEEDDLFYGESNEPFQVIVWLQKWTQSRSLLQIQSMNGGQVEII